MEKHQTVTRTCRVIQFPITCEYTHVHIRVRKQTAIVLLHGSENWTKTAKINTEPEMLKLNLKLTAKRTWTVAQEN
jgi:hypothetical protein